MKMNLSLKRFDFLMIFCGGDPIPLLEGYPGFLSANKHT
jgi:hypothetical protein